MLPNGKILIGGFFRAIDGIARGRLARLHPNGTVDASFNENVGSYGAVNALAVDATGNIFIGGDFQTVAPPNTSRIAKLNPDGVLDTNFAPDYPNGIVRAIAPPTSTAGVVIGGDFFRMGSTSQRRIARLNAATGALDLQFISASSNGFNTTVRALLLSPDEKYYVGGSFSTYSGVSRLGWRG